MSERWLPVPGYEGLYEISDQGSIRSTPRKGTRGGLLRPMPDGRGYLRVSLSKDSAETLHRIHRLVARTFIGPRPDGQEIRHLDGNSQNNALVNLAYGTPSENEFDKVRHGTHQKSSRTECPSGHEYTPESMRIRRGARICLICARLQNAEYRRRLKDTYVAKCHEARAMAEAAGAVSDGG